MTWRVARDWKRWRRVPVITALAGFWGALVLAPACSSEDRLPALGGSGQQGTGGAGLPNLPSCTDGDVRDCHVTLSEHDGVLACYRGTESCVAGRWSECTDGEIQLFQSSAVTARVPADLLALGPSSTCADAGVVNRCDPNCHTFPGEAPDGGWTSEFIGPVFSYTGGSRTNLPSGVVGKGMTEPCRSGFDCQIDSRCVNPAPYACEHSVCSQGAALRSGCDDIGTLPNQPGCVKQVCQAHPECCLPDTPSCSHSPCQIGGPLSSSCNACVQAVCNQRSECCGSKWSRSCVDLVNSLSVCSSIQCPCSSGRYMSADGQRCYGLAGVADNWTDARDSCDDLFGDGWHLASIPSAADNQIVSGMINENVWIGLNDRSTEGTFGWIGGGALGSYTNWWGDQPDNGGSTNVNEDCVEIITWSQENYGTWNDRPCSDDKAFVCEGPAARRWDDECVDYAESLCEADCNVSGQPTGECVPWQPGQYESNVAICDNWDLTIGVPCDDGVLVCNRGDDPAPAGRSIRFYPGLNSNQFPKPSPNLSTPPWAAQTCSTPALAPGQCATVTGCMTGTQAGELVVNPGGGGGECNTKNNWSLRPSGSLECSTPQVCEQGTLTGGAGASCSYRLQNPGNFDRYQGGVTLEQPDVMPPSLALSPRTGATDCGSTTGGWYFDDPLNPTRITLCEASCTALRASSANRVEVSFGCPVLSKPLVETEIYEAVCPDKHAPQWVILTYDTTVPESAATPQASVAFAARSAPAQEALELATWHELRTATPSEPDCGIGAGAPTGCPIDLYTVFGGIPDARNPWLELRITISPSEDQRTAPTVHGWRLDYSCVADQ